jgi:hypothetical protein
MGHAGVGRPVDVLTRCANHDARAGLVLVGSAHGHAPAEVVALLGGLAQIGLRHRTPDTLRDPAVRVAEQHGDLPGLSLAVDGRVRVPDHRVVKAVPVQVDLALRIQATIQDRGRRRDTADRCPSQQCGRECDSRGTSGHKHDNLPEIYQ